MTDLGREIADAVRLEWSDERLEAVRAGIEPRRRRRNAMRAGAAATAIAVAIVGWFAWPGHVARAPIIAAQPAATDVVQLADGSTVKPLDASTVVREAPPIAGRTVIELARGAARFDVRIDRTRVFRVESGAVRVESFGAEFACAVYAQRTQVEVFRGTVRVFWDDQQRELVAGDRGAFPQHVEAEPALGSAAPARPANPAGPARHSPPPLAVAAAPPSWRELAHDGDYDRAYAELAHAPAETVRDEPEELLLAADVERLSHHPAEAIAPLRTVIRDHGSDPRAPLAAFTLGRVLLEELGRPAEAADAFADAVRLAPTGPMVEDAIAREVEALSRGGDATAARQLAKQYVEQFPAGRKLKSVRRFGGIE
jgi:transmembrane sensor